MLLVYFIDLNSFKPKIPRLGSFECTWITQYTTRLEYEKYSRVILRQSHLIHANFVVRYLFWIAIVPICFIPRLRRLKPGINVWWALVILRCADFTPQKSRSCHSVLISLHRCHALLLQLKADDLTKQTHKRNQPKTFVQVSSNVEMNLI